jgi:hypothetical protein
MSSHHSVHTGSYLKLPQKRDLLGLPHPKDLPCSPLPTLHLYLLSVSLCFIVHSWLCPFVLRWQNTTLGNLQTIEIFLALDSEDREVWDERPSSCEGLLSVSLSHVRWQEVEKKDAKLVLQSGAHSCDKSMNTLRSAEHSWPDHLSTLLHCVLSFPPTNCERHIQPQQ